MNLLKKNKRQIKMDWFCLIKRMLIISILILFSINSYAQINKKKNIKVSTRNIKSKNIKLGNKIPLLIANTSNFYKNYRGTNSIKEKISKNTLEIIPKAYSSVNSAMNIRLNPKRLFVSNAELTFHGVYDRTQNRLETYYNFANYYISLYFDARRGKAYRIRLQFECKGLKSNCSNPKLNILLGRNSQSFRIVNGINKLDFIVHSNITKNIGLQMFNNIECNGQYHNRRDSTLPYPTFKFKEIQIRELED